MNFIEKKPITVVIIAVIVVIAFIALRWNSTSAIDVGVGIGDAGGNAIGHFITSSINSVLGQTYTTPSRVADCPDGYTNAGASCYRGPYTYGNNSHVADCPGGRTNTGTWCGRGFLYVADTLGMDGMTCPKGSKKHGARCYPDCKAGYTNNGETCGRGASSLSMSSMTCKEDEFKTGARCYKECEPGYTSFGEFCRAPAK